MPHNIALVGNPNCGKTTLFNELTGSNQYVGNWPGVTVEKKVGHVKNHGFPLDLIDLPGIYSLSPYTMEEVVTRDYLINERPEAVINIIDGTNIERNLYLSLQVMELGLPMVIAVNMMDDVAAKGESIDCERLSALLGVSVIPIVARRGEGSQPLLKAAEALARGRAKNHVGLEYDGNTKNALSRVLKILSERPVPEKYPLAFCASKLLEADDSIAKAIGLTENQVERVAQVIGDYESSSRYGDRETLMADARYNYITSVIKKAVIKPEGSHVLSLSDKIDKVVTNRVLALPIFFLVMLIMFSCTFGGPGAVLKDWVEGGINAASGWLGGVLDYANAPDWTRSLLLDAVFGGVGGVLSFIPQVSLLFLFLSVLEDSGYMARAAFIMDRMLRKLGLTGRSFIPMLMGFGCTTPAVMAARGMGSEKDRRLTIMLTPFMSCGAKLPIYGLFAGIFFPSHQGLVVFSMYITGLIVAIICGLLLKNTLFKGEVAGFMMELPPYRLPTLKSLAMHVWEKCRGFLIKAGTIIFSMSVLVWLLRNFGPGFCAAPSPAESFFGIFGRAIAPVFAPLGFGSWQASVALLTGLVAKESVVSTLNILYGAGGISAAFNPISAYAFMLFSLLYMPCMAAFVTIRRELGSTAEALRQAAFQTAVAYVTTLFFYQIATLISHLI